MSEMHFGRTHRGRFVSKRSARRTHRPNQQEETRATRGTQRQVCVADANRSGSCLLSLSLRQDPCQRGASGQAPTADPQRLLNGAPPFPRSFENGTRADRGPFPCPATMPFRPNEDQFDAESGQVGTIALAAFLGQKPGQRGAPRKAPNSTRQRSIYRPPVLTRSVSDCAGILGRPLTGALEMRPCPRHNLLLRQPGTIQMVAKAPLLFEEASKGRSARQTSRSWRRHLT